MTNYQKIGKKIVLSMFSLSVCAWSVEIHSDAEAVNLAGKQRMFTQNMLKDYTMIGMHNTFGNPQKNLKDTIHIFSDHMIALENYTHDSDIKQQIKSIEAQWKELKTSLELAPTIEQSTQLQEKLETMLQQWDDITKALVKQSGKKAEEIINISGRQRMLSQKMASLYMLKVWGVNDPKFKQKLNDALTLFKTSLNTLQMSTLNTKEITTLLEKVKRSFVFFEMMNKSKSKFVPTLIYKKSNDILHNMDRVTILYTQIQSQKKEIK